MAGRSLENLRSRYNAEAPTKSKPGFAPGPRKHGGPPAMGKPREARKTIARIFGYLRQYKLRLVAVVCCLLLNTAATLAGSYMLRPILNHIADGSLPAAERVSYLISMLIVLLLTYMVAVLAAFL